MPPLVVLENVLQALTAGLLMGTIYGLMCVGLGLIFGVMRVINFAQGDFLMLGMYASLYLIGGFGMMAALGPYWAPYVGAMLAGPVLFIGGYLLAPHLVSRAPGLRVRDGPRLRPRPLHPVRARHRGYGGRRRARFDLVSVSALCRLRLRHHHVCRRRARRHGQHPGRVLGRPDDRHGAADVDPG